MADIALDLEEYGFSAHVYYMISTMLEGASASNTEMIDHWLYCLEKMGVTSIKQLFQGEHELKFDRISAERHRPDGALARARRPTWNLSSVGLAATLLVLRV